MKNTPMPITSRRIGKDFLTKLFLQEYLPDSLTIWLVFDMNNGNKGRARYCWWFEKKKHANDHIKWQKEQRYSAELSKPQKVKLCFD